MRAYIGKFLKKDGSEREMTFCRICDIPVDFLSANTAGSTQERILPEGMELVWDLESDGFRTFNHNTIIGELREINVEDSIFI